jgi:aspartyl-tRNA(Asn)/glutamyl-tRNA(Gln) amidotransferase subunit A
MTVGRCPDLELVPLAPDIQAVYDGALERARVLARGLEEVQLPEASGAYETFGVTQRAEALFSHVTAGLYPARADEYGPDVRGRLALAEEERLHGYLSAAGERQRLRSGFARLFDEVEILLTPVCAASPVPIGDEALVHLGRPIEFREVVMSYTVPQDLAGLPSCVVRAGFDALGIPVGVQFTGPPWSDAAVLGAAHAFYGATSQIQEVWPAVPEAAGPPETPRESRPSI